MILMIRMKLMMVIFMLFYLVFDFFNNLVKLLFQLLNYCKLLLLALEEYE